MTSTVSSQQQQQDDDDLLVHPINVDDDDDDDDDDVEIITGTSTANTGTTSTSALGPTATNAAAAAAATTSTTTSETNTSTTTTTTNNNNNKKKNNNNNKWKLLFEKKLYLLNELSSKETYLSLVKWIEFNRQRMINDFIPILLQHFTMLNTQYFIDSNSTTNSSNNNNSNTSSSLIRQGLYIQLLHELLIDEKDSSNNNNNNTSNTTNTNNNNSNNKKSKWDRFYDLRIMIGEHVLIPLIDEMILILLPFNNTTTTSTSASTATNSSSSTPTTTTINLHEKIVSYIKEWDELNVFETPTLIFQIKRKINISKQQQRKKQQQLLQQHQLLLQQQQEQEQAQAQQDEAASAEAATAAAAVNDTTPTEPVALVDENDKEGNSDTLSLPRKRPNSEEDPFEEENNDDCSSRIQKKRMISEEKDDVAVVDDDIMEDDFVVIPAITSSIPNDSGKSEQEVSLSLSTTGCNDKENNSTTVTIKPDSDHVDTTDDHVIASVTSTSDPMNVSSSDIPVDSVTSTENTAAVAIPLSLSESNMTTTKPTAQSAMDDIGVSTSSSPTATSTATTSDIPTGTKITHSRRSSSTGTGSTTTIAGVPYDFEASGIPAETIDTRDIIDHCKTIATLQIARDVQNDSAVQLLSLLSSIPEDIKKTYMTTTETDTDTTSTRTVAATEPMVLSDVQARDFSMRTNERIIQMNINDELNNVQTFYELISRQQVARTNLIQLLIKSRCTYGSNANATAYYNTSSLMKQLLHRKSILLDSMELEGLDVEDDTTGTTTNNTTKKDIDVEQLLPLPWFQIPDTTSTTKTLPTALTSNDDDPSLHNNIDDTNDSNDAKRQKVV